MADEEKEDAGDEGAEQAEAKPKKEFKISSGIVNILKWVLVGIMVVIVSVTSSFIVVSIFKGSLINSVMVPSIDKFRTTKENYSWYSSLDDLRGSTNDTSRHTFIIKVNIAYPNDASQIQTEIVNKTIPITDLLLTFFADKSADYLRDINNREEIRELVKQKIASMMSSEDSIKDIRFTKFQVLDG